MSNPIPSQIALSTISNGTLADGSVVQANDAAIEAAVNAIIAALSNGANGQFLKAADSSDVVWEAAASLVATGAQSLVGPLSAKQLGFSTAASVAATGGTVAMTSGLIDIASYDGSFLTTITGHSATSTLLVIRNSTAQGVVFGTGGGTADAIADTFIIPIGGFALLLYDTSQSLWTCLSISGQTNPYRQLKNGLTFGGTVTPNAAFGSFHTLTIPSTSAFTIGAPANPPGSSETQQLIIELFNNSGGSHGTITFNSALATGFASNQIPGGSIPNGKRWNIPFFWNGTLWALQNFTSTGY